MTNLPITEIEILERKLKETSREDLELMLLRLIYLAVEGPSNEEMGICFNLAQLLPWRVDPQLDAYDIVTYFSNNWEKHSGDSAYPIGDISVDDKWEGQSGALRRELMQYIIKGLTKYIKDTHAK